MCQFLPAGEALFGGDPTLPRLAQVSRQLNRILLCYSTNQHFKDFWLYFDVRHQSDDFRMPMYIAAQKVCCWFSIMTFLTPPTVWRSHVPLAALTQTCSSLCSCCAFLEHRPVALEPIQWSPPLLHGGDSLCHDGDPGLSTDWNITRMIMAHFRRQDVCRAKCPAMSFSQQDIAISCAMTDFDGFRARVQPPYDSSASCTSDEEDSAHYSPSIDD